MRAWLHRTDRQAQQNDDQTRRARGMSKEVPQCWSHVASCFVCAIPRLHRFFTRWLTEACPPGNWIVPGMLLKTLSLS